ncbi:hypothetical protein DFJ77DRAFT_81360 [Powellomyces hirtus]|nr:hypothetical protein DFJ77DRAFT_81360 [Powellomyces hirtus]
MTAPLIGKFSNTEWPPASILHQGMDTELCFSLFLPCFFLIWCPGLTVLSSCFLSVIFLSMFFCFLVQELVCYCCFFVFWSRSQHSSLSCAQFCRLLAPRCRRCAHQSQSAFLLLGSQSNTGSSRQQVGDHGNQNSTNSV